MNRDHTSNSKCKYVRYMRKEERRNKYTLAVVLKQMEIYACKDISSEKLYRNTVKTAV